MKSLALLIAAAACAAGQPARQPGLYATFETSEGAIVARLYEKEVPNTVRTFVGLAEGRIQWFDSTTKQFVKRPFYQNMIFHRVVPRDAIQAGDPTGMGNQPCGIRLRDEFLPGLRFDRSGRLAVANGGEPDTGGCQFFITANVAPQWNGKYTIFGDVVEGQDVVSKISRVPVREEKPITPVKLIRVTIERIEKAKKK
jgi:cyclophilin family peptidyl-prolyl cis-trans isomerase